MSCLLSNGKQHCTFFQTCFSIFFVQTDSIQGPAHINYFIKFIFPAEASSCFYVLCWYVCMSMRLEGYWPKVWAVITQIQSTDWLAPAGCTLVAIPCPMQRESLTCTLSAYIAYDTVLALPVTAGWLPDCSKCQWPVPTAPGKTSKPCLISYCTSLLYCLWCRIVLLYVSGNMGILSHIIPMWHTLL